MSSRPSILVVIKGLGIGGAERLISEGARFWDRERFDYRVCYFLPWKDQLVPDLEHLDVPVRCIGSRRGATLRSVSTLRTLIRTTGPSLVHAHLPSAGIIARIASSVPVVYTEHNLAFSYRTPTRWANRLTYRRNRAVIAVSEAVAESLRRYPGPRPRVIPNGVAVDVGSNEAGMARKELGLDEDDPLVVHVGNIRPGKGHDNLVAAAELLHARRPDVTIVSLGVEKFSGDLDRLRTEAAAAGLGASLLFLGRRADALSFVATAQAFVNPSEVEGLPLAVLEAMALGVPVAATAVGGVPSVIRDGDTGILVPSGDPTALAAGIEALLSDRATAAQLAQRARDLVNAEYGLEAMVGVTEQVYREVLSDG